MAGFDTSYSALSMMSPQDVFSNWSDPSAGGGSLFNPLSLFAGMGAFSSFISGFSQYQAGLAQQAAYDFNAQQVLQQMQEEEEASAAKYQAVRGKQIAAYGRAGVDIASGSPLLVLADTAMRGAEEISEIGQAGSEQAALDIYQGKVAAWSGEMGGINTFLSGLSKAGMGFIAAQKGAFGPMMS